MVVIIVVMRVLAMLLEPRVVLVKVKVGYTSGVVEIGVRFAQKRVGLVEMVAFWLFLAATEHRAVAGFLRWLR